MVCEPVGADGAQAIRQQRVMRGVRKTELSALLLQILCKKTDTQKQKGGRTYPFVLPLLHVLCKAPLAKPCWRELPLLCQGCPSGSSQRCRAGATALEERAAGACVLRGTRFPGGG